MPQTMLLSAFLLLLGASVLADEPPDAKKADHEKLLVGVWRGGPCMGILVIHPNHLFERHHYSPGNHKLTGSWELNTKSNLPLITLTTKTTDAPEWLPVGEAITHKLLHVDEGILVLEDVLYPSGSPPKYKRVKN